jgi:tetratricopeptide (TPR) repeat protein
VARAGVRVFAIGVGTPAGDVVPVLDDQGRAVDVKRDEAGGPVHSRLDQGLLETLAHRTGGAYFSASRPGGELPRLLGSLGGLTRGANDASAGERLVERPVPRFAWFGAVAALLLALERIRRRRRSPRAGEAGPPTTEEDPRHRIARSAAAALLLGALLPLFARPAQAQSDWAKGDRAFRRGDWAAAESLYARRAKHGNPPEVQVNLATVRARAGKTDQANDGLQRAESTPGRAGQMASYNLGTLRAEKKDYEPALAALRHALERQPGDEDARYNYEWVLRQREKEKQSSSLKQPQPQPSQPNQSNPNQQPQPQPSQAPSNPQPSQQPPPPQMGRGLNRMQAEQLLGSLQELERLEQQRLRQVRVMRERRGRDW